MNKSVSRTWSKVRMDPPQQYVILDYAPQKSEDDAHKASGTASWLNRGDRELAFRRGPGISIAESPQPEIFSSEERESIRQNETVHIR